MKMSGSFVSWMLLFSGILLFHAVRLSANRYSLSENTNKSNLVLGGYFGVHKKGPGDLCGKIDQENGVYLVEAMRYAIRKINANSSTLFGLKLDYRITDTCNNQGKLRDDVGHMFSRGHLTGVIGPETSQEAMLASTAFGIYRIAVVSFSASSINSAYRRRYFNFFRTIPSDDLQDRVLVDLIAHFNWSYISIVNSHGRYVQRDAYNFIAMLRGKGICIATHNVLPRTPSDSHFHMAVRQLNEDPKVKVVVLLTTTEDTHRLVKAARSGRKFTWLSTAAWKADRDSFEGIADHAKGALILNYAGMNNDGFRKHFMGLKLSTKTHVWFKNFWEDAFKCSLNKTKNTKFCTGNESLSNSNFYGRYTRANAVIDAVNSIACAVRNAIKYVFCYRLHPQNCARHLIKTKEQISKLKYMKYYVSHYLAIGYSNCSIGGKLFDKNGTVYRDIEVLNFDGNNYKTVGIWKMNKTTKKGKLKLNVTDITWSNDDNEPPFAICSLPCKTGEIAIKSAKKFCCFTCKSCGNKGYVSNNTCVQCGKLEMPNKQRTSCNQLPVLSHSFKDLAVQFALAGSIIGICLTTGVLFLFIKHKDAKVIKASSRELSLVILIGLYLSFISPILYYLQPTQILCGFHRFIFGMTLTIIYTPLMLKTNRIFRLHQAATNATALPKLVSPKSQILICLGLLGIQVLLCVMWVVGQPPVVQHIVQEDSVAALCKYSISIILINLVPCFCLMSVSTIYAFKTRNFPKNYNEASSIGITMYISCFLWAIYIPLLLLVKTENNSPFAQIYTMANFSNILGLVSLIGLFGPKVRRVLFLKENLGSQHYLTQPLNGHIVNNSTETINCSIELCPKRALKEVETALVARERSKSF